MTVCLNLISDALARELEATSRRARNAESQRKRRASNPEHCASLEKAWLQSESGKKATRDGWKRYYGTPKHKESRRRTKNAFKSLTYTRKSRGAKDAHLVPQVFELQGSVCAICKTDSPGKRTWHADHDHSTGLLRGLLCANCNIGLGMFKDNPDILSKAIAYLESTPADRMGDVDPILTTKEKSQLISRCKKGMVNAHIMPALALFQDGRCGICSADYPGKNGWNADHDHATGKVRGALCNACNSGLGNLKDSLHLVEIARGYLIAPPADQFRRVSLPAV